MEMKVERKAIPVKEDLKGQTKENIKKIEALIKNLDTKFNLDKTSVATLSKMEMKVERRAIPVKEGLKGQPEENIKKIDALIEHLDAKLDVNKPSVVTLSKMAQDFNPIIAGSRKVTSRDIPTLQTCLNTLGYDSGVIDGVAASKKQFLELRAVNKEVRGFSARDRLNRLDKFFKSNGSKTQRAIYEFQKENGLKATGFVNARVLNKIQAKISFKATCHTFVQNLPELQGLPKQSPPLILPEIKNPPEVISGKASSTDNNRTGIVGRVKNIAGWLSALKGKIMSKASSSG